MSAVPVAGGPGTGGPGEGASVGATPASTARARDAVRRAAVLLGRAGVPTPRVDAELLLAHVLGVNRGRVQVLTLLDAEVAPGDLAAFRRLVERRAAREPLQHLTGTAGFRGLELAVGPGVFVPRPETEVLAQLGVDALRRVDRGDHRPVAVDLGTGSGAVAFALAAEVPDALVVGVENGPRAYVWARENAARLALPNVRVVFADLAAALPQAQGCVDVVVSNPPYIPAGAVPRDPEVRLHDPQAALYGGEDGLDPMRAVVATAERLLRTGGVLAAEHGESQGAEVRALLDRVRWADAATHPDLTGRDRCTTAVRRPAA